MATPTTTIDALPIATEPLAPTDLVIVQQSGVTKKATVTAVGAGSVTDVVWVGPDAPSDPTIELWYDTDAISETGMTGSTVDTGEPYRIIMFSDGTVRAIPIDAVTPTAPIDLVAVPRISSVKLTWDDVVGATSYTIYRDGVVYATTATATYRDGVVVVGETYTYTVRASNFYGLFSDYSDEATAYIDPALNNAPVVEVRTWPTTSVAVGNRVIVRVNAFDLDAQVLAFMLGTDVGSLIATSDPSVWYLEPS